MSRGIQARFFCSEDSFVSNGFVWQSHRNKQRRLQDTRPLGAPIRCVTTLDRMCESRSLRALALMENSCYSEAVWCWVEDTSVPLTTTYTCTDPTADCNRTSLQMYANVRPSAPGNQRVGEMRSW